jgi:hypothetical protein
MRRGIGREHEHESGRGWQPEHPDDAR